MANILIVEDEEVLGKAFRTSLEADGHLVFLALSAEEAFVWLQKHNADLALIDVRLPGADGIDVLRELSQGHPDSVAIMMTAHGDVRTAVEAMKLGAADFLIKPIDLDAVSMVAQQHLHHRRLAQQLRHERRSNTQTFGLHQILGNCPEIERAKFWVRRLSRLDIKEGDRPPHVLITGETGTGKDLLAKAFHYEGPRSEGPFVHVNCGALPESLVESELFGHTKGAFTDAASSKRGLFEAADGGTLFLDEIGSLPMALQAKLLTAIETGRIRPVGAEEDRPVDVQLIAAMNQDPQGACKAGTLREDLYHRLRVVHIHLPPLRDRGADLNDLAEDFVKNHCRKFGMPPKPITPEGKRAIRAYHWPGNVRELCHRLESAVLLSQDRIDAEFLPEPSKPLTRNGPPATMHVIPADFTRGPVPLEGVERELIQRALSATKHNVSRAAQLLSISRDALRYRIDKYGLASNQAGGNST